MSTIVFPQVAGGSGAAAPSGSSSGVVNSSSAKQDQDMFLQLLVSELQNQDPMNPVQGTDFVTQLAQFQTLQQQVSTGGDVTAIRTDLDQLMAAQAAANQS